LSQGFLLVAVGEVPGEIDMNGGVLQADVALTILTTTMPDGSGIAILAFTDLESLQTYAPGTAHVAMAASDVLKSVIDQGYEALIINAAGPWAGIPREDVLRILEGV
jgi:SseB protein N-terminal domain